METKKGTTKKLPIAVVVAIVVLVAVVGIVVFVMPKEESYRQIQVYSLDGTATVERASVGTMEAYANMMLQTEDRISVPDDSSMQLKLDEDKYVFLEPGTEIRLEATGDSTDSKTKIHLEKGAIISNLENKLSDDSSYEVTTPSSTMAVRGTTFRVEVKKGEDGTTYTVMSVFDGTVTSCLTGETEELLVESGFEIIAREDGIIYDYVVTSQEISYEDLKTGALDFLKSLVEKGEELSISEEVIEELISYLTEDESEDESEAESEDESEAEPENELEDESENESEAESENEPKDESEAESENESKDESEAESENEPEDESEAESENEPEDESEAESENEPEDESEAESENEPEAEPEDKVATYTITFTYNKVIFATQVVNGGECATEPRLMPTAAGYWDYDFTKAVNEDITVEWIETE